MDFNDKYLLDDLDIEDEFDDDDDSEEFPEQNNNIEQDDIKQDKSDPKPSNAVRKKKPLEVRLVNIKTEKKNTNRMIHVVSHVADINLFTFAVMVYLCTFQFKKGINFFGFVISLWIHLIFPSRTSACAICNKKKEKSQ